MRRIADPRTSRAKACELARGFNVRSFDVIVSKSRLNSPPAYLICTGSKRCRKSNAFSHSWLSGLKESLFCFPLVPPIWASNTNRYGSVFIEGSTI